MMMCSTYKHTDVPRLTPIEVKINRAIAEQLGESTYTGVPHRVCGETLRYTKTNNCVKCHTRGGIHYEKRKTKPGYKEKTNAQRRKSQFGITQEEYDAMREAQGYVCVICKKECRTGRNLAVDHDHTTGKIRGLLCQACNQGLGHFFDNTGFLERAVLYLQGKL